MAAIDATARVADGARIGDGVEIGPCCLVGPHVELKNGVRLVGHVNVTGATAIGEGTVVYPFASLGTTPQSVHYRGEPTKLVIGPRCQIREGVTMNEPHFVGHFPDNPVMPGVLMVEGMAQTASILVLRLLPPPEKQRIMFFLTIDKA